jgi:hypothetical protein
MIGCILLGAAGLFTVARLIHGRHHGYCGGGHWRGHHRGGWGHHGYDQGPGAWDDPGAGGPGMGMGGGLGARFGRGFILRTLLDRLEATPAQERVIRDAVDEFHETTSKLRGEGRKTRADVAGAFRKSHFDAVLFGELFARHDSALEELRKGFVGVGARIHDALDERQRARLADLIEAGPGRWARSWPGSAGRGWSW